MAGSRFAYVRDFELPDPVLPGVYMVVRIDGKGFHKFSDAHRFTKPNDVAALELMNRAALHVCESLRGEVTLAFGESDEYSFLFKKSTTLYNRRESKILTYVVSLFTSAYVFHWSEYMQNTGPLLHPPTFDGRVVLYPAAEHVRDYFAWRQADTHINNLYNTVFWALVLQGGQSEREAHATLKGTVSSEKNEILYSQFGIKYGELLAIFRKGTTIAWVQNDEQQDSSGVSAGDGTGAESSSTPASASKGSKKASAKGSKIRGEFRVLHVDIIGDEFWLDPADLSDRAKRKLEHQQQRKETETKTQRGDEIATADHDKVGASTAVWESPRRLNGVGMGRWVL